MAFPPISFLLLMLQLLFIVSADTDGKFGYSGAKGPEKWGSLDPKNAACSSGKQQSPVNIEKAKVVKNKNLKPLERNYEDANATLVNYGFSVGLHFEGKAGEMSVDGKKYTLIKLHWHTPSEHKLDGEQFAAELHLVHKAKDGSVSVLAILYKHGDEDPLVKRISKGLETMKNEKCKGDETSAVPVGKLETKTLKKKSKKYYRYMGSLTTPPCAENITWNILGKVRTITKDQIAALQAPLAPDFKHDARPTQPLNDRKIDMYEAEEQDAVGDE